ncbi:hypothetical protein TWF694_011567 [Orbilia ellipsospora]|uniref:Clr5 domain-containing protein n=1 Tax=Orbilia ellipsospora TaxID=2528407 RepID=A0AAV9X6Q5_9PEZI
MSTSKVLFKPVYDGARVKKRGYRRNEDWDDHKDFILDLVKRKVKQDGILEALKNERGFQAKANQLKRQLGMWGISKKNLKKNQRKWMVLISQKRKSEGKETRFYFSDTGLDVPESQVTGVMRAGLFDIPENLPGSPGELMAETPPPQSEDESGPSGIEATASHSTPVAIEESQESTDVERITEMDLDVEVGMEASANLDPGSESHGQTEFTPTVEAEPQVNILINSSEIDNQVSTDEAESTEVVLQEEPHSEASSSLPFRVVDMLSKPRATKKDVYADMAIRSDYVTAENQTAEGLEEHLKTYAPQIQHISEFATDETGDAYYEISQALDSLTLNDSDELEEVEANNKEYLQYLKEWTDDLKDQAITFLKGLETALRVTRLSFADCFLSVYQLWIQQQGEEPFPYPVSMSIIQGTPIKSVINPKRPILTASEWGEILSLYNRYYEEMKGFATKEKPFITDNDVQSLDQPFEFCSRIAHLEYLYKEFGGSNYLTIASLRAFALMVDHAFDDTPNSKFLLEMSYKAHQAIGMELHQQNAAIALDLSVIRCQEKDYLSALRFQRLFYQIQIRVHGESSTVALQILPDIALSYWKIGEKNAALSVLKMGLRNIGETNFELLDDQEDKYIHLQTLFDIGQLLKRMKCKPERNLVFRFAVGLHQRLISTRQLTMDDDFADACWTSGRMYDALGDKLRAIEMFRYTMEFYGTFYGELYWATISSAGYLCNSVQDRGMALQIVPTIERIWKVCQSSPRQDEDRTYEVFMMYSNMVFRVNGLDHELKNLAQYLIN